MTRGWIGTLDMNECVDATNNCFIKGAHLTPTHPLPLMTYDDTLVAVALYTDGSPNEG